MIRYKWPRPRVSSRHLDMDLLQNFQVTQLPCMSSVQHNSATTKSLLINETSISDNQIQMVANLTFRLEPKRFHFRAFSTAES